MLLGPRSAPPATTGTSSGAPPGAPAQSGWDVLTPFTCADCSRILVNRGWVPRDATSAIDQPCGLQRLSGVLRQGDRENKYGVNDLKARRLVWLDLSSLASATGSSPVLVVATDPVASGLAETPPARAIARASPHNMSLHNRVPRVISQPEPQPEPRPAGERMAQDARPRVLPELLCAARHAPCLCRDVGESDGRRCSDHASALSIGRRARTHFERRGRRLQGFLAELPRRMHSLPRVTTRWPDGSHTRKGGRGQP